MAVQYAVNKGRNVTITGYPLIDKFLDAKMTEENKKSIKKLKNIIWAPHHTIDGAGMDLNFSNFLRYYNFMIQLAEKYKDNIFITFKPHPALKPKLSYDTIWGKEKTDAYYQYWQENDFCGFNDGNYICLFEQSDALIHDCDSFMGEYLSLNKPVLYTRKDDHVKDRLNKFGQSAIDVHYQAQNEQEIISFIDKVIINEMDPMKQTRTDWIKTHILPPNHRTASMNIFEDLKTSLNFD
jgi:CDP-glycerol glycerophosphotransferase (TagB/SpsB family)